MADTSRVRGRYTRVTPGSDTTSGSVRYQNTTVVSWDAGRINLNAGGYRSATTKLRMNQAGNQFGLGYHVYQRDFVWFVRYRGVVLSFVNDTLTLDRVNGGVLRNRPPELPAAKPHENAAFRKLVDACNRISGGET